MWHPTLKWRRNQLAGPSFHINYSIFLRNCESLLLLLSLTIVHYFASSSSFLIIQIKFEAAVKRHTEWCFLCAISSSLFSVICFAFGNENFEIKFFIFHVNFSMRIANRIDKNLSIFSKTPLPPRPFSITSSSSITEQESSPFRKYEHNSPDCYSIHSFSFISGLFHVMCALGSDSDSADWLDKTLKL
jgi:hypothetical protein